MEIVIEENELFRFIKKAVREVFQEETSKLFLKSISIVSKEEMKDIESLYGRPHPTKEVAFSETIEI